MADPLDLFDEAPRPAAPAARAPAPRAAPVPNPTHPNAPQQARKGPPAWVKAKMAARPLPPRVDPPEHYCVTDGCKRWGSFGNGDTTPSGGLWWCREHVPRAYLPGRT